MKTPYLVQRLKSKPKNDLSARISQAFAFGGGGSGMSKDQWRALQQVFDIDYMGAAEYEFGVFPKAVSNIIANIENYVAYEFVIPAKDILPNWDRRNILDRLRSEEVRAAKAAGVKPPRKSLKKLIEKAGQMPITDKTIYVFGRASEQEGQITAIRDLAADKIYVKNGARMRGALDPITAYDQEINGWFDLDNECFFFLDREIRDATGGLLVASALALKAEAK